MSLGAVVAGLLFAGTVMETANNVFKHDSVVKSIVDRLKCDNCLDSLRAIKDTASLLDAQKKALTGDLIAMIKRGEFTDSWLAVAAFGEMGKSAKDAQPLLRSFLNANDSYLRVCSASALCKINGVSEEATTVLKAAVVHEKGTARFAAILALGEIGPDAVGAVPTLLECFSTYDDTAFTFAVLSLARIGIKGLPFYLNALNSPTDAVREGVCLVFYELADICPYVRLHLQDLINNDPCPRVKTTAKKAADKMLN